MMSKVIFLHGMKTGGTSLRYMLLAEYGYERVAPVPVGRSLVAPDYPINHEMPLQYQQTITPEMVEGYDVVMSHYDWDIVGRLPGWSVITLLREPVDQLVSLYRFMKESRDFPLFNPSDFMTWVRSAEARAYLNGQTKMLSSHRRPDVDVAIANLGDERLTFGILEQFGKSVELWNERFGWSLDVYHLNKTRGTTRLTDYDRAEVERLQADDMRLYYTAVERFDDDYSEYFENYKPAATYDPFYNVDK